MTQDAGQPNPHIPVRPDWLALQDEPILEPELRIVDPHHHLWDNPDSPYFFDDLVADMSSGHNVVATVFVQCLSMYRAEGPEELKSLGETEFVNGAAAQSASGKYGRTKLCHGIVGHVDLRVGARAEELLQLHMAASGGRFRGIRNISAWHPVVVGSRPPGPAGLLEDPRFRQGVPGLGVLGLTFGAWCYHTQLDELYGLAKDFPDTTIVMDHIGGAIGVGPYAGRRDEVFRDWRAGMRRLAELPNMTVKLGGLGMRITGFDFHDKQRPPTSEELAKAWNPYFHALIEDFGPDRCMFESNFPVDKGMTGFATLWNAFKRCSQGFSADEKAALHERTAARVYRLDLPA